MKDNARNFKKANLILEDGSIYEGYAFGSQKMSFGEVVFSTAMTGYQEMLTDPSFAGQIVVPTYPLIGNYGIRDEYAESSMIQVSGFVVRQHSLRPSNGMNVMTLHKYLESHDISAISGVDTRAITRRLRVQGVMMGIISVDESRSDALARLSKLPKYKDSDFVSKVSTPRPYIWNAAQSEKELPEEKYRIVVTDCGLKYNILRMLRSRGCEVMAMPATSTSEEILERHPDGVMLSPGPGDPELINYVVQNSAGLVGKVPIMGICLGNQVIGKIFGARTFKLKFGHRGTNHPVKELKTGLVRITAQNHGYSVDPDTLQSEIEVSHINLNDGTVEGLRHKSLPVMSIQFHSEASPGPLDSEHVFDEFLEMVRQSKSDHK